MNLLRILGRGTALLGAALTGALLAGTAQAQAAPSPATVHTVQAAATPEIIVKAVLHLNPPIHHIGAGGSLTTHDVPGRHFVAIQLFLQRHDKHGWVTVVKTRRAVGVNSIGRSISWRRCTPGRVYRVKVNYDWDHRVRGTDYGPSRSGHTC